MSFISFSAKSPDMDNLNEKKLRNLSHEIYHFLSMSILIQHHTSYYKTVGTYIPVCTTSIFLVLVFHQSHLCQMYLYFHFKNRLKSKSLNLIKLLTYVRDFPMWKNYNIATLNLGNHARNPCTYKNWRS